MLQINLSTVIEDSIHKHKLKGSNPATGDRKCHPKIKFTIRCYELTKQWGIAMFNVDDSKIA